MKIPAEFAPKSWEMPPGFVVLEESASVVTREFDGEKLDWLVALVEIPTKDEEIGIYWMRPMSERYDAGLIVHRDFHRAMVLENDTESYVLRASLSTAWKNNRLARQFFLNERDELCREGEIPSIMLLVAADGIAGWISNPTNVMSMVSNVKFKWDESIASIEFLHLPTAKILERLQFLLNEPNSEARFSHRFAVMNEQEREEAALQVTYIVTKEEAEKALRDLLLSHEIWMETPEAKDLQVQSSGIHENMLFYWDSRGYHELATSSVFQTQLDEFWYRFTGVRKELAGFLCVRNWLESKSLNFTIRVSRPTAHEQLEAALRWREWKANHEKL